MEFEQMQQRARAVRSRYAEVEASTYGRSWTTEEVMLGFLGVTDIEFVRAEGLNISADRKQYAIAEAEKSISGRGNWKLAS